MIMGFSFKNLFKKDEPQEDTEHVSLEKAPNQILQSPKPGRSTKRAKW